MKSLIAKSTWLGFLGAILLLTACGGGGGGGGGPDLSPVAHLSYTGNTDPVAIDGTNADAVSSSITDGSSEAIGSDTTSSSNPFGAVLNLHNANSPLAKKIAKISVQALQDSLSDNVSVPAAVTYTSDQINAEIGENLFCGGTISVTDAYANGSSQSGTIRFNNLCFDMSAADPLLTGTVYINGKFTVSVSGSVETVSYENVTVSYEGESYSFSGTEVCDYSIPECSTLYVGNDGETYKASITVTGDNISGYDISGTFYDPTYGRVDLTTDTVLTFNNCPGGVPETGAITFTGATGSLGTSFATLTFNDCSTYTVDWDDGSGIAGTIYGTW